MLTHSKREGERPVDLNGINSKLDSRVGNDNIVLRVKISIKSTVGQIFRYYKLRESILNH